MKQTAAIPSSRLRHHLLPSIRLLIWLAVISLAQPFAALAQTTTPAPLPPAAQEAMEIGIIAAQQQEFLLAIRNFQDARKIAPAAPILFFNLGLAESKIAGRELRAMTWFGAYLEASPGAANAAAVREQIKVLDIKNQGSLARLIRGAEDAAKQFGEPNNSDRKSALRTVAKLWAKSGDIEMAKQIAVSLVDSVYTGGAQADITWVQAKMGDFAGALKTADAAAGYKDNAMNYVATAQREAGELAGALQTTGYIQDASTRGWAQKYIAEEQAKAGDFGGSLKTAELIGNASAKSRALSAVAKLQMAAGNTAAAVETAGRIQDIVHKGETQRLIAAAQMNAGNSAGAIQTANGIQDAAQKDWAQLDIVEAQIAARDITMAIQTASRMQDTGLKGAAQRYIAKAQAAAGAYGTAFQTADQIQHAREKSVALGIVLKAQAKAGDAAGVQKTVDRMRQAGSLSSQGLRDIAEAQALTGDIAGAKKTADSIPAHKPVGGFEVTDYTHKGIALLAIVKTQVQSGDIAGAQKTLDSIQAVSATNEVRSQVPFNDYRSSAQQVIGVAQAMGGDIASAQLTASATIYAIDKNHILQAIVDEQIRTEDVASATRTAELITGDYQKGRAQKAIAAAQAKAGDIAGAQRTADSIQDTGWKVSAQNAMAAAQPNPGTAVSSSAKPRPPAPTTPPAAPAPSPTVDLWITKNDALLNAPVFLSLDTYLKSLPADNAQKIFNGISDAAEKIADARYVITKMLKQQAKR